LDLDSALQIDPNYKDALYRKALSCLSENETGQALELLDQVISIDPKNKLAYNAKGLAYQAQGDYKRAIGSYDRALEIDEKWQAALTGKMNCLLELGKDREAADILSRL